MKLYKIIAGVLITAMMPFSLFSCSKKNDKSITLPVVNIKTENSVGVTSRDEYVNMTLSVTGTTNGEFDTGDLTGKIRGRGNSSWDFLDKKSYRVKLESKKQLLGIGEGPDKDWVFLANGREKSMLRNWAVFRLAELLGLNSIASSFATVYLDGAYIGVYEICELVEVGDYRVDIDDVWTGKDCGFLVELDKRALSDNDNTLEVFYVNDYEVPFAIKSKVTSKAQNTFIKSYFDRVDDAIMSGNRDAIDKLVDIDSLINMYIVQEFSKNRDVGFASFNMYRDAGGKLIFGPPWDFDLALGNDNGADTGKDHASPDGIMATNNRWYEALVKYDWFMKELAARWYEVGSIVEQVENEVQEMGYKLEREANLNYEKWKIMGKKQLFEPWDVYTITSYLKQVDYLVDWMKDRRDWLDDHFEDYWETNSGTAEKSES